MVIYEFIFDLLKENGFNVFAPNTHKGECVEDYLVLKETMASKFANYSTQVVLYDVLCYAKNYTDSLKLKEKVRATMLKIQHTVKPTDNETEPFFDDDVKGYMTSVEYRNYRRDLQ